MRSGVGSERLFAREWPSEMSGWMFSARAAASHTSICSISQ